MRSRTNWTTDLLEALRIDAQTMTAAEAGKKWQRPSTALRNAAARAGFKFLPDTNKGGAKQKPEKAGLAPTVDNFLRRAA